MNSPLKNITTIAKRELGSYFASPVAYVFIVIFLLMLVYYNTAGWIATDGVGPDLFEASRTAVRRMIAGGLRA